MMAEARLHASGSAPSWRSCSASLAARPSAARARRCAARARPSALSSLP